MVVRSTDLARLQDTVGDEYDATGAAVAVAERVDALELVVNEGHLQPRIGVGQGIVVGFRRQF